MSSSYITEPPTKGKVILKTTAGDLEIELWPKEIPKACRNFVQLCMEGYYDDTIFHRVVKGFIVQGGDPTGTGSGGESIYGGPFQDEFHSRLRFSHRGILAMANTGANQNLSQFFFTLDRAEELQRQNTIFGKVVGDTLFNLLKIGEAETDSDERPIYSVKILSTIVLSNPFDDIEPRTTPEERRAAKLATEMPVPKKTVAKKKNTSLLSFGEDIEEGKIPVKTKKIKSSHDVLEDETLSKEVISLDSITHNREVTKQTKKKETAKRDKSDDNDDDEVDSEDERISKKIKNATTVLSEQKDKKLISIQEEIRRVQKDISTISSTKPPKPAQKKISLVESLQREFLSQGTATRHGRRNQAAKVDIFRQLKSFKDNMKSSGGDSTVTKKDEWVCQLHGRANCASCRDTFGEEDEDDGEGWMNHSLKFEKAPANVYEPKLDDYIVEDFRELQGKNSVEKDTKESRRRR